ncbi:hypothetical protein GCM10009872_29150 [Actinopolymorpha rutila]
MSPAVANPAVVSPARNKVRRGSADAGPDDTGAWDDWSDWGMRGADMIVCLRRRDDLRCNGR